MYYLLIAALLAVVPALAGWTAGRGFAARVAAHKVWGTALVMGLTALWLGLAYASRRYADGDRVGWRAAEWFAHRGRWYIFAAGVLFLLGASLRTEQLGRRRIATVLVLQVLIIWLLVWRTMPSYVWLPRQDTRDKQGHVRQSIEYTCGPVSLANLLKQIRGEPAPTERELARLSMTTVEGTPTYGLIRAARAVGLEPAACEVMTLGELRSLDTPAIVQISTLPAVHHATLLLRIDGDMIDFIDPAYGERRITAERFTRIWYGKTLVLREKE